MPHIGKWIRKQTLLSLLFLGLEAGASAAVDEVCLIPLTHLDIGFTAPLDTVAMQEKAISHQAKR